MKRYHFILILLLLFSCNDEDNNPIPKPGYDYYPLEKQLYRDYIIHITDYFLRPDSTLNMVVPDSTKKLIYSREICVSRFLDSGGDSASRVEIYTKKNLADSWPFQPDSIAIIKLKNDELIYEVNNRTYLKLLFPVKNDLSWNGNKFNNLGNEIYRISEFEASLELTDTVFSPSLKVTQSDIVNLIEVNQRTEEYVLNVGLARKNTRILQYRQSNGEVLTGEIEKGTVFSQEIIDYGKI